MLFQDFEKYLKYDRQLADTTIQNYRKCTKDLRKYLKSDLFHSRSILEIQRNEMQDYLIYIKDNHPNKPYVLPNSIIALRAFFNWLSYVYKKPNLTEISFYLSKIVKVKKTRPIPIVPTPEEIIQLRKTIHAYKNATSFAKYSSEYKRVLREYALIELLITTGIRSGELRNLRLCDIDLKEKTVFIRQSKTNCQRVSIFNGSALHALVEYFEANNFNPEDIIFSMKQGNVVNFIIKRWAKKAAINKNLHAHSFRHYFITESQRLGVRAPIVAQQVGHRDLNSTMYYTHLDISTIRQNYERCEI